MKLINLTPHELNIVKEDGTVLTVPKPESGLAIPRLHVSRQGVYAQEGIKFYLSNYGQVENLPAKVEGVTLIVSAMIRQALPERTDLVSPGNLLRNAAGSVIGCEGLDINQ